MISDSYENQYLEDDKRKSSEKVKDQKVMTEPLNTELISNQEVKEVKKETKSSKSNSSTERDLDVFLLGEGNSDDEPGIPY